MLSIRPEESHQRRPQASSRLRSISLRNPWAEPLKLCPAHRSLQKELTGLSAEFANLTRQATWPCNDLAGC
jgi:hypothetical protein